MNDDFDPMERDQEVLGMDGPLITRSTLAQQRLKKAMAEHEVEEKAVRDKEREVRERLVRISSRRLDRLTGMGLDRLTDTEPAPQEEQPQDQGIAGWWGGYYMPWTLKQLGLLVSLTAFVVGIVILAVNALT
jgi:hypothetical protein